jgi:DNA-binding NarL/FixJ family response regulator
LQTLRSRITVVPVSSNAGRALIIGMSARDRARYDEALQRVGLESVCFEGTDEVSATIGSSHFAIIIVMLPLGHGSLEQLVTTVRSRESACADSAFLVLAPSDQLAAAARMVGRGVNKVLSTEEYSEVLVCVLKQLLGSGSRFSERISVCVEAQIQIGNSWQSFQTENISATGMLTTGRSGLEVGAMVRFRLQLPEVIVEGEGKVIRQTTPNRETVPGYGIRFGMFTPDSRQRLTSFLRSLRE